MNAKPLALSFALALTMAGCASSGNGNMLAADAPRALPSEGPVSVAWNDPASFTELRTSSSQRAAEGSWLTDLAKYMRKQAAANLPPGNRLQLTIVDIDRAGQFEPWRGPQMQDVRIIRDIYPPRMTVRFRETDPDGAMVSEGERKISDLGFTLSPPFNEIDPLRYEKRMVDDWLQREFPKPVAVR